MDGQLSAARRSTLALAPSVIGSLSFPAWEGAALRRRCFLHLLDMPPPLLFRPVVETQRDFVYVVPETLSMMAALQEFCGGVCGDLVERRWHWECLC